MSHHLTIDATTPVARCGMSATSVMDRGEAETTAALLKAVADPMRLQLLSLIRAAENHEACVCDLTPAVGLSQPTVSHHLKVLREAGVVTGERRGTNIYYALDATFASRFAAIGVTLAGLIPLEALPSPA